MKYTLQCLKKQTNQTFTALIRYAEATENIIRPILTAYNPLPSNIQFIPGNCNIENQLLRSRVNEKLYLVHLDCDDMYDKSFIRQLHEYNPKPETCVLINQAGYVYDSVNHHMAAVTMPSPPFYTWIYNVDEYLKGKRYKTQGHRNVINDYKHEILTDNERRNFMAVVHKRNKLNQKLLTRYEFVKDRSKVDSILRNFM